MNTTTSDGHPSQGSDRNIKSRNDATPPSSYYTYRGGEGDIDAGIVDARPHSGNDRVLKDILSKI